MTNEKVNLKQTFFFLPLLALAASVDSFWVET